MKLLLVEDDALLSQAVIRILEEHGYDVDTASNGLEGLEKGISNDYETIILDVMLPGLDGFSLVSKLRENEVSTPVLMLTALGDITSKIEGLDSGADSYMTKPFAPSELLAQLRALNRRQTHIINGELVFGDLTLDIDSHDLSTSSKKINLSLKEHFMMAEFMKARGRVLSKSELGEKVWGESDPESNNVESYISFLRKKLDFLDSKTQIETLRKVGYRLVFVD